ncbi:unnamed protein product [Arctogadus glacialis]
MGLKVELHPVLRRLHLSYKVELELNLSQVVELGFTSSVPYYRDPRDIRGWSLRHGRLATEYSLSATLFDIGRSYAE